MGIYLIKPKSALHIGEFIGIEREATFEYIPSDTLFAAMVVAWAQLGEDVAERIVAIKQGKCKFRLTSAFPFAHSVRFYPMPQGLKAVVPAKQHWRIRWVSQKIFEQLLQNTEINASDKTQKNFIHDGSIWISTSELQHLEQVLRAADEKLRLWSYDLNERVVPRVYINRTSHLLEDDDGKIVSRSANIFHSGRVTFSQACGLWFSLVCDETTKSWVQQALDVLMDSGLGGLRSTGHGAFSWHEEKGTLSLPLVQAQTGYGVLLSRYAPYDIDDIRNGLLATKTAYTLITVGGWSHEANGKAWRRNRVCMVREGSVVGSNAQGHIVDVTPQLVSSQRVYRYGMAYGIAIDEGGFDV